MFKLFKRTNYQYVRFICPCCGYPTLDSEAGYDICIMCNWEDDGQGDEDADIIRGGPNGDYSLTEARANFSKYLCMYEPNRDMRLSGGDSPEELEQKKRLKVAYKEIGDYTNLRKYKKQYKKILKIEQGLINLAKLKLKQ